MSQVPDVVQPLVIALAGAVPFIEGEASAALGVIGGVHPVVAALAGMAGNLLCVVVVVLLGSRIREAVVLRRAGRRTQAAGASGAAAVAVPAGSWSDGQAESSAAPAPAGAAASAAASGRAGAAASTPAPVAAGSVERTEAVPESKGRARLRRWLVKFGVPGASLLAPLALPTMITAATFVASGVPKGWVILWQAVAIVVWTTAVTLVATGVLAVVG
ncbi:small multidrug efflux protein [Frigoribacterium sp. ACAM 257]|nr:small multidrug efflux protein [Frigoribacterium sp. ACAM 257]